MGLYAAAAQAISGAVGAYQAGKAQKSTLRFQERMGEINARVAEGQAQTMLLRGQREEQNVRLRTAHLKSAQRTSLAANGIDLNSQTAVNVLTSTDVMGEIDANTVAADAVRAAWGYRTQSTNALNEALLRGAAANGISAGGAAASSLVGSAGTVAQEWYRYEQRNGNTTSGSSGSTSKGS